MMKLMFHLKVVLGSNDEVLALYKALKPDDEPAPEGMSIASSVLEGTSLTYSIEMNVSKCEDILTAANVIDEVLRYIDLVVKVLRILSDLR